MNIKLDNDVEINIEKKTWEIDSYVFDVFNKEETLFSDVSVEQLVAITNACLKELGIEQYVEEHVKVTTERIGWKLNGN